MSDRDAYIRILQGYGAIVGAVTVGVLIAARSLARRLIFALREHSKALNNHADALRGTDPQSTPKPPKRLSR